MGTESSPFQRGLDCLKEGRYAEARKLFDEQERRTGRPEETAALLREADGALAAAEIGRAAELYAQVLERNPGLSEVYVGLARIALFTGQLDEADVHVAAALKLDPDRAEPWMVHGLFLEMEGDVSAALESLDRAATLGPAVYLCQYNYGRALAAAGYPKEAIAPLEMALRLEPASYDALSALGVARKKSGQLQLALAAFQRAKDVAPEKADAYATLADVLFETRNYPEARKVLDEGLARCGDHPALLEKALAVALAQADKHGAVGYVERELVVAPQHEQAWVNLANLCLLTGDLERSERAAKELMKRNPRNWEARYHLGNLYEATGLLEQAETEYRRAVELAGKRFEPRMNLGIVLLQEGSTAKVEESVRVLEHALTLAPAGEWRVHYNLALAKAKQGKTDAAFALLEQLLTGAAPTDPIVEQAKILARNLGAEV